MQLTKPNIFLALSLSFIVGVFSASFFGVNDILIYLGGILAVILFTIGYKNKIVITAGMAVLFLVFGVWITSVSLNKIERAEADNKSINSIATVIKEPEKKENYQRAVVTTDNGLKILVNASLHPKIEYGDELRLKCNLEKTENFSDDFDYRMYLAVSGIYYTCKNAKIKKTGNKTGNKIYSSILFVKNKMESNINRIVPEPQAALANGLLFGGDGRLSKRVKDNFSKTGMTHIVAVSGYNVTIIAEYLILLGIFLGFWRKQAFWFALVGIFIFVAMIGFPSSAVRAGVMGTLLLWAMKNGRLSNSLNAIVFAGVIMLTINPLLLRWDVGFQLSFLATLGIISLAPFWEKYFLKKFKALGLTEILILTISAQVFVLPIIIYNFKALSLVSLFANLLILPIVPITMLLVFLTAISGFVFEPLSLVFAWLAYLPLKYEVWVVDFLAEFEWSSREVSGFGWGWVVAWYAISALLIYIAKRKTGSTNEVPTSLVLR